MTQVFDTPLFTTDQGMERLLKAGLPVLLVLVSGGATAEMRRELERIARERAGKLLVALTDVRDAKESARRFAVTLTPAVVDVRDGGAVFKSESAAANGLEAHARFLLGEGSKPAAASDSGATPGSRGSYSQPIHVTDATFDRVVLGADRPVVVDFWAPWCGPCRITNPMVERLAGDKGGKIIVAKLNVDDNPGISERYGIQSIPTMMVVKNGSVVDRWAGALPEEALRNRLAPFLS
jgi:thioredoxin 1